MDVDLFGRPTTSDPYVQLYVDGKLVGRTGVKHKTLSPEWNEGFHVHLSSETARRIESGDPTVGLVTCLLLDRDFLTADDNMGIVVLSLSDVSKRGDAERDVWYPVRRGTVPGVAISDKVSGDVCLRVGKPKRSKGTFDDCYALGRELGEGAFSVVREGIHLKTDRAYAVKIITKSKLSDEDESALEDEISILKDLRHPHIIRLYEVYEDSSLHYLVTEMMDGGELFDRIVSKTYYNEREARDVVRVLLEAVNYCHFRNVAHRDLKPENLLLVSGTDDSDVKIADFGFAKRVVSDECLTTRCGTPGYVAPEILRGVPYGTQADMWSLGVIAYVLLGGYPPFNEEDPARLFKAIRRGEYEFHEEYWGHVSQEAKGLISKLLIVDPRERLTAERALRDPWIGLSGEELEGKDLGTNLEMFRAFNAKRKFKAAVKVVMAFNKMNSLGENFLRQVSDSRDSDYDDC